jgi:hypothetical protein
VIDVRSFYFKNYLQMDLRFSQSSVFWHAAPCKPITILRHFGETLQAPYPEPIKKSSKQQARGIKKEPREGNVIQIETRLKTQRETKKSKHISTSN